MNYNKLFTNFLEQREVETDLFSYKDYKFGCLSIAAGVLLCIMEWLGMFLEHKPQVSNKLACLVRDFLELPYLKFVFLVFVAIGV